MPDTTEWFDAVADTYEALVKRRTGHVKAADSHDSEQAPYRAKLREFTGQARSLISNEISQYADESDADCTQIDDNVLSDKDEKPNRQSEGKLVLDGSSKHGYGSAPARSEME